MPAAWMGALRQELAPHKAFSQEYGNYPDLKCSWNDSLPYFYILERMYFTLSDVVPYSAVNI